MDNIYLKDYVESNGLFIHVKEIEEFSFFDEYGAEELDVMLISNYGRRSIYDIYKDVDVKVLSKWIVISHSNPWNLLINFNSKNDLDISSSETIRFKEDEDFTNKEKSISSTENKVSGFNSGDLIVDSGLGGSNNIEGEKGRGLTNEKKTLSLDNVFKNLQESDKFNIINKVLLDTSNYICKSIY